MNTVLFANPLLLMSLKCTCFQIIGLHICIVIECLLMVLLSSGSIIGHRRRESSTFMQCAFYSWICPFSDETGHPACAPHALLIYSALRPGPLPFHQRLQHFSYFPDGQGRPS